MCMNELNGYKIEQRRLPLSGWDVNDPWCYFQKHPMLLENDHVPVNIRGNYKKGQYWIVLMMFAM